MGKSGGISDKTQNAEVNIAQQQTDIAKQQQGNAQQEYNASFPGFQTAENYYKTLSTGDPTAIARSIAPATQQINAQSQGNKERIEQDTARGGSKNLALAENEINKGAQVGNTATQSFLQSFQSLAGLSGQGIGQSNQSTGLATGALQAAGNQQSQIANQQAEGKASQLGFISSLAGSGAELAGMCWIAEALYSRFSFDTYLLRYYVNEMRRTTWIGRVLQRFYARYGQRIAAHVRYGRPLYFICNAVFQRVLTHAREDVPAPAQWELYRNFRDLRQWCYRNAS